MLERAEEIGYAAVGPFVEICARAGISANSVTFLSGIIALVTGVLLYVATTVAYMAAVLLIFLNGVLDIVDGELARRTGTASRRGDLLDHSVDRYADAALVGGAAAGVGEPVVGLVATAGVVMVADMGAAAQARGADRVYGGLLTRADILTLVVIGTTASALGIEAAGREPFVVVLWILAVAGHATVVQRAVRVVSASDA